MIGAIVAADKNNVIAVNDKIPWHYPADFKRFKEVTQGGTLIMGSATWQSIPGTLPGRNIVVVSLNGTRDGFFANRKNIEALEPRFSIARSVNEAFELADKANTPIWVAGGTQIYNQTIDRVDFIDFTLVPEVTIEPIDGCVTVKYFPKIGGNFGIESEVVNPEDPRLTHKIYRKINGKEKSS